MKIARSSFVIAMLLITVAWIFDVGGMGRMPWFIIVAGYVVLISTLPKPRPAPERADPSFARWLVDGVMVVGCFLGAGLFGVASGFLDGKPLEMNLGVKLAIGIFAAALTCPFISRLLQDRGL